MRLLTSLTLGCILLTILTGCDSPFNDSADSWRHEDQLRWRIADDQAEHRSDTLVVSEAPTPLSEDAGPEDYVKLALAHNPSIIAARRRTDQLKQNIPQVTSLDDPMFQVAPVGQMAQTASGEVGLMTSVSQKLPFPGKLDTRGRIAAQDVAMAQRDLASTRLSVAADVRRAYWSFYLTQRQIEVTTQNRKLLDQLHKIAKSKYESGTATQQDVLRASIELSDLENQLITLHQQQKTAMGMLNHLMDRAVDAPLPPPKTVELTQVSLKLDDLLADAAKSNPQLRKVHDRIEAYRQRLKLARLNRWPDLTVSMTYNAVEDRGLSMAHNGRDQWWLGFGINLPIWQDKRDAAEQAAMSGMLEGVADLTAAQNRLAFEVRDAMLKVETQQRSALLFRDVIVPQAEQAVRVSQSAYRAGQVEFLTLIDNWRKVLAFELMYHQNVAQMQRSLAQLQQVIGKQVQP